MLNFFDTIIEYIEIAWSFLMNIINGLISLFTALAGAIFIPQALTAYVFGPLSAAVAAVMAFGVIKIIVGRNSI